MSYWLRRAGRSWSLDSLGASPSLVIRPVRPETCSSQRNSLAACCLPVVAGHARDTFAVTVLCCLVVPRVVGSRSSSVFSFGSGSFFLVCSLWRAHWTVGCSMCVVLWVPSPYCPCRFLLSRFFSRPLVLRHLGPVSWCECPSSFFFVAWCRWGLKGQVSLSRYSRERYRGWPALCWN